MKKEYVNKGLYVNWFSVAPGVWRIKDLFVNVYLIHNHADKTWTLVDCGLKTSAEKIKKVAELLFWPKTAPSSIILTHAHFDHIGSLRKLANEWNVPVYAHAMERPYLGGISSYPPPDPTVGGGMMSLLSFAYPKGPIDVSERLRTLPEDGTVPGLPEWKYFHTPGHAPGHISLFRETDRLLLAGDAFVTTCQESLLSVILQTRKVHGPPKYFTYDWSAARASVEMLAGLNPEIIATGHGRPMTGEEMRIALNDLVSDFSHEAVPSSGRYVDEPAIVSLQGVEYIPPRRKISPGAIVIAMTAAAVAGYLLMKRRK